MVYLKIMMVKYLLMMVNPDKAPFVLFSLSEHQARRPRAALSLWREKIGELALSVFVPFSAPKARI